MKLCNICGASKARVGIKKPRWRCPECHNTATRIHRRRAGYKRPTGEALVRARAREYSKTYIKRGVIKKGLCEVCGSDEVQQHHDDYSKPLEIRWLCRNHHLELHGKICHRDNPAGAVPIGTLDELSESNT